MFGFVIPPWVYVVIALAYTAAVASLGMRYQGALDEAEQARNQKQADKDRVTTEGIHAAAGSIFETLQEQDYGLERTYVDALASEARAHPLECRGGAERLRVLVAAARGAALPGKPAQDGGHDLRRPPG